MGQTCRQFRRVRGWANSLHRTGLLDIVLKQAQARPKNRSDQRLMRPSESMMRCGHPVCPLESPVLVPSLR
jgi:hypothetical protein